NLVLPGRDWLTDENDTTCNDANITDSVSLKLDGDNIFTWLKLVFTNTDPIKSVSLQFNTLGSFLGCFDQKIIKMDSKTLHIWCSLNVTVNQVNITGEGVKSLCSVYVSGGRNVALKQPTNQSSTYDPNKSSSLNAVDGNTDGNYNRGSCTHTNYNDQSPTWTVSFNETFLVNKFVLYNRAGGDNVRLKGFQLQAFNGTAFSFFSYKDNESEAQNIYTISQLLQEPTSQVQIKGFYKEANYLTLCEVEIYGDCPEGKEGLECNKTCLNKCPYNCNGEDSECNFVCFGNDDPPACHKALPTNVGVIVGPVVSVILILCLGALAFVLWRRRSKAKRNSERPTKMRFKKDQILSTKHTHGVDSANFSDVNSSKMMEEDVSADAGYYNTVDSQDDTTISIAYFNMFMSTHKKQFFIDQFKAIPSAVDVSTENANSEHNKNKNRYKNICTYDHSRVNLKINIAKNEGDYINASYIKGFGDTVEFIASQGPNKIILNDFVRMLWEQNTERIVMLTNLTEEGKTKCEQYWPDEDKIKFGDIKVKLLTTTTFSDYTIRRLELAKKNEESHHITHYQFHSWPDKGVPVAPWSLVDFAQKVSATSSTHLTVVHCSAGVGRTGTFIALLNIINQAAETGKLNFFETVTKLRQDRIFMVQTAAQYEFLHKAVQTALVCINSTMNVDKLKTKINTIKQKNSFGQPRIEVEWKRLCDTCSNINTEDNVVSDEDDNVYQNTLKPSQHEKDRFPDILPKIADRPFLKVSKEASDDYINAVFIQGIQQKDRYILTQLPMLQTVDDFWRLVTQYKINTIVAFEVGEMSKDKTITQFLPTEKSQVFNTSVFEITSNSCKQTLFWDDQRLTVKCNSDTTRRSQSGKIAFLCKNGAEYSELACVLNLLLERLDMDNIVNVPLVVGSVKLIRPEVIQTVEQYRLIYDVLEVYHDTFAQYNSVGDRLLKEM
ncbi:hypothetical protein Btru_033540, partial [Bulinus truncatus]